LRPAPNPLKRASSGSTSWCRETRFRRRASRHRLLPRDLDVESRALTGNAGAILAAASGELDLLACGSRGRSRPVAALLGSVSTHLATHAKCPLLVVAPGVQRSARSPLGVTSAAV
jgi:hypothetical protein